MVSCLAGLRSNSSSGGHATRTLAGVLVRLALRFGFLLRHLLLAYLFNDSLRRVLSLAGLWDADPRSVCHGPLSSRGRNGSGPFNKEMGHWRAVPCPHRMAGDGMGASRDYRSTLERDWLFSGLSSGTNSVGKAGRRLSSWISYCLSKCCYSVSTCKTKLSSDCYLGDLCWSSSP